MTLISRIRAALDGFSGRTRTTVPDWADWIIGHPFIPPETLDDDFRDAFRKVPIIAAGIGRVQHDVASLPMRVWLGEGERRKEMKRQDGNLVDLLNKANPRDTGYQLRVDTVGSLKGWGNAYWFLQRFPGSGKEPRELWCLKPHLMEVVPGTNRAINRYIYNRGGVKSELDPADIIHFRKYNPDDHPIGMSELEPVRKTYQAQFYAHIWIKEFYKKGGMLAGVWALKDGTRKLTDPEIRAIQERLKRLHVGVNRAWDPVIIDAIEFVRRGLTLTEMELDKQMAMADATLCRAMGIPPWMMGIKEGSTLGSSGAGVDQNDYVFGTLKREAMLIDTTINEQLAPLFGSGITVETDFSGTLAAQNALLEQAKSLVIATGRAVMTVNEARQRQGLEEHEDPTADELYVRATPDPFGMGGEQGQEPKPRPAPNARRSRVKSMIEGNEGREQLRRRNASALDRAESRMLEFLKARLAKQERVAIRRLRERWEKENPSSLTRLAIDINGLVDPEDDGDEAKARRILADLLRQRGQEAADELADLVEIAEAIEINLNAERVVRFLDKQVQRAIIVPDGTTKEALRQSLAEGVAANESLADLTARVRSVFATRQNMAATIARTETLPGFNLASQEAWLESGVVEASEWLSARDSAVREAHADADGQRARLGEPFIVGGDALEYPGDPSGAPENTINCRCSLLPVVSEDAVSESRWAGFMKGPSKNGHASKSRLREYFGVKR